MDGRRLGLLAVLPTLVLWGCAAVKEPDTAPLLSGTFLQIDASMAAWSPEEWERELDWMRSVGLELIVLQYAGYGEAWWYPGSFDPGAPDLIGQLLDLAAARGMQVFLGLYLDPAYWSGAYDLEADLVRNRRVADELAARYAAHEAFAGWYMVLPHFRCNLDTGRRIFLESREPLYDTQDWGFVACGGSSGDLAWSLSKRDRIPPRSFWSWKARP